MDNYKLNFSVNETYLYDDIEKVFDEIEKNKRDYIIRNFDSYNDVLIEKISVINFRKNTFNTFAVNNNRNILLLAENSLGNPPDDNKHVFRIDYYLYILPASYNEENEVETISYL